MVSQKQIDPGKLIEALGPDAAAMAEALRALGVKGRITLFGKECPLARYLRREGCDQPVVSNFYVQWAGVYHQHLSGAACYFVQMFDSKEYPFLIEEDEGVEAGK